MEKFLEFVADIFEVSISEISMETEYKKFEKWDSLMMMNLVMEVEDEYGITIPMEEVGNIKTLRDFYELTK